MGNVGAAQVGFASRSDFIQEAIRQLEGHALALEEVCITGIALGDEASVFLMFGEYQLFGMRLSMLNPATKTLTGLVGTLRRELASAVNKEKAPQGMQP